MSDEFKLQWSVSLPPVAQYAKGHMFNFRADTVAELEALFDTVLESETVQKALDVASLLTAGSVVTSTPTAAAQPAQGATVTPINGATAKFCEHGQRERKEGVAKSGRNAGSPYVAHYCPLPQGNSNRCKPIYEDA